MESDAICQGATAGNTWVNILTGFKTSRLCALFMIDKDGRDMIISVLVHVVCKGNQIMTKTIQTRTFQENYDIKEG